MIDLKVVKEQYERMSDEELLRFAKNESQSLTLESFHLLKSAFELRNLDLNVIEIAQVDRELAEATKLSEFEKITAFEFTETIWKFAFDEKENGKSNEEIYRSLLKKNISSDYAYMLIESMESKAKELVDSFDTHIIIGWVFIIAGGLLIMFTFNSDVLSKTFFVWGALGILAGFIRLATCYNKKKKFQTIVTNIQAEQDKEDNLYQ